MGKEIISGDPHNNSKNGRLLKGVLERQNMFVVNALDVCVGLITRHRNTIENEEESVIDYVIVCEKLLTFVDSLLIDEEGDFLLTKFSKLKKKKNHY